jgi:hypothetical protein
VQDFSSFSAILHVNYQLTVCQLMKIIRSQITGCRTLWFPEVTLNFPCRLRLTQSVEVSVPIPTHRVLSLQVVAAAVSLWGLDCSAKFAQTSPMAALTFVSEVIGMLKTVKTLMAQFRHEAHDTF